MTKTETAVEKKVTTQAEKVKLRNPDIRGITLIKEDNTSLFIPPKGRVTVDKADISKTIRSSIKSGLVQEE